MNKSLFVIVIIIIIAAICFIGFGGMQSVLGGGDFKVPEGYYENGVNNDSSINVSDGVNTFYVKLYDDANVSNHVGEYLKYISKIHKRPITSNYTFNNMVVNKISVNGTHTDHYFFAHNGKSYDVYTWNSTEDSDKSIINFIQLLVVK